MRIGDILDKRRESWTRLEAVCDDLDRNRLSKRLQGPTLLEFSALYRSACSDLAMADAYQLPPTTVEYLHRLVGRAHNQLYRSRSFAFHRWFDTFSRSAPQQIFSDICVQICAVLFFGLFVLSALIARLEDSDRFNGYSEAVVGRAMLEQSEDSFSAPIGQGHSSPASTAHYAFAASFYIQHNTSIGLRCFALGPLILPTIWELSSNAVMLGAIFGYMSRDDIEAGENFFHFVTAHGPFELTAIVLSAAAGLRLGLGLVMTNGLTRVDSVKLQAVRALPVIMTAVVLFILAAFTEGFLSPSPLPYWIKVCWAIMSSGVMMFYFVVLGYPRGGFSSSTGGEHAIG